MQHLLNRHEPTRLGAPLGLHQFSARFAQKETVHPVFDPSLGSGEVCRLLGRGLASGDR
jgi:hypothetical protein